MEIPQARIRIISNGPYIVTGNLPLSEKIIVPKGNGYEFRNGREFPRAEQYALCRCGKSKNMPFCDGSHIRHLFIGTETASKARYRVRARLLKGPGIDLLDDNRCAFARFCHRERGNVWELVEHSNVQECRDEAIKAASDCPSGRLVAVEKSGREIEPEYAPSIEILQDPEREVSGGLFVKGNIEIESSDGRIYEKRNRVVLCRCGESFNKPFCDAMHVSMRFSDHRL